MKIRDFKANSLWLIVSMAGIIGIVFVIGLSIGDTPEFKNMLASPMRDITIGQAFIFAAVIGILFK